MAVRGDRSSWRGRKASGGLSGTEEVVSEWLSGAGEGLLDREE